MSSEPIYLQGSKRPVILNCKILILLSHPDLFVTLASAMLASLEKKAPPATFQSSSKMAFISADVLGDQALTDLIQHQNNLVLVFSRQEEPQFQTFQRLQTEVAARNVFFVFEKDGASAFINRWFRPGSLSYRRKFAALEKFFARQENAGPTLAPENYAFISSTSTEANKIQSQYISNRFFFRASPLTQSPETRLFILEYLLTSPDLFTNKDSKKVHSVEEWLRGIFEKLMTEQAAHNQLQRSA